MKTAQAYVGARGVDSVGILTSEGATALKGTGINFALQYLGSVTALGVQNILSAGLAFMPVTYADRFDGPGTVSQLQTLGLSLGCTVWLDLESISPSVPIPVLIQQINAWASAVSSAGFQPGLYVGANCQLTSLELYQLGVVRYWHSMSRIIDRNGQLAEPSCGYSMHQLFPSQDCAGWSVDLNFIQEDFQGRLPNWVVA